MFSYLPKIFSGFEMDGNIASVDIFDDIEVHLNFFILIPLKLMLKVYMVTIKDRYYNVSLGYDNKQTGAKIDDNSIADIEKFTREALPWLNTHMQLTTVSSKIKSPMYTIVTSYRRIVWQFIAKRKLQLSVA